MASLTSHRVVAVLGCLVDGVLVGGAEAALDHPARSPARRRLYALLGAVSTAELAFRELPRLRRVAQGMPIEPVDPAERALTVRRSVLVGGWGLLATVVDGPLARALHRRGARRPHLVLGTAAGVATAASTLPLLWSRASVLAVEDLAAEQLDEELAELLDQRPD